jgi:HEAT repeat protein
MTPGKNGQRGFIQGFFLLLFCLLLFPANAFLEDSKGIEELIGDLRDEATLVRWQAAEQLGKTHDARAVGPLIEALGDVDAGVRREATKALGEIQDPRAVKPLGKLLEDREEFVRVHALEALEKIGGDKALDLIIGALKNTNPLVRVEAAASLGRIGYTRAVAPLEAVAESDARSYVRFAARQALVQIEGQGMRVTPERVRTKRVAVDENTTPLIAEMAQVAERIQAEYGLVLDYQKYDIMDLLDIEARMRMRHPQDTIESLLGDLLTAKDKERNRHLFEPKQ